MLYVDIGTCCVFGTCIRKSFGTCIRKSIVFCRRHNEVLYAEIGTYCVFRIMHYEMVCVSIGTYCVFATYAIKCFIPTMKHIVSLLHAL